jgi:hypothetical protein
MRELKSEFLCEMDVELKEPPIVIGEGPFGLRRIGPCTGGTFSGPSFSGEILNHGADWNLVRRDGVMEPNTRAVFKTDDGALVYCQGQGIFDIPLEWEQAAFTGEREVDPDTYYWRLLIRLETASEKYDFLNRKLHVGVGAAYAHRVHYSFHTIV